MSSDNLFKVHMIGNAHLDSVWLWRWQEGFAEIKATFRSALDRMKEFPDFVFTCACAAYYKWVEENCPEMFEEIKARIKEGRWVVVGGWWIQPDCNIPSGESFVRHGLYSQRYFNNQFGVMAKVGYNVDSFGHNGMLPQILKKSGLDQYVFMRPGDHEKELPGNLFLWESMDGSRVLTYKIPHSYNNWWESNNPVKDKAHAVLELAESLGMDLMNFYGVGNHGGGPTIANIMCIRELQEGSEEKTFIFSSPEQYFQAVEKQATSLPVICDDLQHHASGCYSAHSEIKALNRKAEHRLGSAEKFSVLASQLLKLKYPFKDLQVAWEKVLFNQFHDILGGCSIKEAYDDAREFYGMALTIGAEVTNAAIQKISWDIDTMESNDIKLQKDQDWMLWETEDRGIPLVVFNPLSWEVTAPLQVNKNVKGITDDSGQPMEIQQVRGSFVNVGDKMDTLFIGRIPAMGYRLYRLYSNRKYDLPDSSICRGTEEGILENSTVRVEIDGHSGFIKRFFDKTNRIEVLSGMGAVPAVIDEHACDTWAHRVFSFDNEVGIFGDAEMELLENGPVRARLRVISQYNASVMQQDFMIYPDRPDLEVRVKLDWREKNKLLKLSFPVNVEQPEATYEIPYGFITRPVNGEEEPGQQWLDVSGNAPGRDQGIYGLSLLNDCKYSFSVKECDMRMTVVRSPAYGDHFGERDQMCEYMDQGIQEFRYVLVPHAGKWQDSRIVQKAYELNVQPIQMIETYHKGSLPAVVEGVKIEASNVVASVFKMAEDGAGYILRCYETGGAETTTMIDLPLLGRKWSTEFGRCEIKTFLIPMNMNEGVQEVNLVEIKD